MVNIYVSRRANDLLVKIMNYYLDLCVEGKAEVVKIYRECIVFAVTRGCEYPN
jgi:hypothetical protein